MPDQRGGDGRLRAGAHQPSFSVIVPCYNYGHFLVSCLRSVLDQPGVDVSVLVIDDASSDNSFEVAAAVARDDPRVEVRRHERNVGHIGTYNEGIAWASAEFMVLLSADDMLAPASLERAARVFAEQPRVGLVYGQPLCFSDEADLPKPTKTATDARRPLAYKRWNGMAWLETRCRMGGCWIISPEAVVRTSIQHQVGGYNPNLPHSGDEEMWMRFAQVSDIACIAAHQGFYRVHDVSMSRTRFASPLANARQRKAAFDSALARSDLHALAREGLARLVVWQACRAFDANADADFPTDEVVEFATSLAPDSAIPELRQLAWRRRTPPSLRRASTALTMPWLIRRRIRRLRLQYAQLWWRFVLRPHGI